MKMSAKARYGLVCMIRLAEVHETKEPVTLVSLSERLGFSKIYLEQVFSLLKRSGLVNAIKGASGGYVLSRQPGEISVFDIFYALETSLFEKSDKTVEDTAANIEATIQQSVFGKLDMMMRDVLSGISLAGLVSEAEKNSNNLMYYL